MSNAQSGPFGPLSAWTKRDLRASDADREMTVEALRQHAGDGRLTVDEMSDRIDRAYAARTLGELDVLVKDLPTAKPSAKAGSPVVIPGTVVRAKRRKSVMPLAIRLAIINVAFVVIWAFTGGVFWPIWFIVPSAVWVALRAVRIAERRRAARNATYPQIGGSGRWG